MSINIYTTNDTGQLPGGGGATSPPGDNGNNSGTELLLPTYEWYLIKLQKFKDDNGLDDYTLDELEEIISIECMGDGNPLVGEFEECAEEIMVNNFLAENSTINSHIQNFLDNHQNSLAAQAHRDKIVMRMIADEEFKSLVESSFTWSAIMWSIAKDLVIDKAVDILAGIVGAKDVADAIKALMQVLARSLTKSPCCLKARLSGAVQRVRSTIAAMRMSISLSTGVRTDQSNPRFRLSPPRFEPAQSHPRLHWSDVRFRARCPTHHPAYRSMCRASDPPNRVNNSLKSRPRH